ncbi:MAG: branched-chain amino acid ABC transporter permease [Anaerolineae bacterium]|jgi:branched-chain amino acid transport system permease protein|nr:branched-chain amino acid ABC transporter permease [Anaerolineae bacterium]
MRRQIGFIGAAAVLVGLAGVLSPFQMALAAEMLIAGLFALSLNLIMGFGGMVHFGHAAFYGVGGYAYALLTLRAGLDPMLAFALAPLIAAGFAAVIGWFCVRRTRLYFSILTLAFGQLLYIVVFQARDLTGGDDGLQGLRVPPWLETEQARYLWVVGVFLVCFALIRRIAASPFMLTLKAVRDNPERAQFLGVDVRRQQWVVFVVGGTFAGVAGALFAVLNRFVAVNMLFWATSSEPILGSLMGGMGSLVGPVIGGGLLIFLEVNITRFTLYWPMILGIITILFVLLAPDGLTGLVQRWRTRGQADADRR